METDNGLDGVDLWLWDQIAKHRTSCLLDCTSIRSDGNPERLTHAVAFELLFAPHSFIARKYLRCSRQSFNISGDGFIFMQNRHSTSRVGNLKTGMLKRLSVNDNPTSFPSSQNAVIFLSLSAAWCKRWNTRHFASEPAQWTHGTGYATSNRVRVC